jgi:hypothetical protein
MGFTKTQSVEKAEVLTPDEHQHIFQGLRKLGKTSVKDLTEVERKRLLDSPSE